VGEVVHEVTVGPVRAQLIAAGPALALFRDSERNAFVRFALTAGGAFWLDVFLPKRFSDYSTSFGYRVSRKWRDLKIALTGVAVPFVGLTPSGGGPVAPRWKQENGAKMVDVALADSRARATATGNSAAIIITIPYGHPVQADTSDMFRTLPSWEVDRIADVVGQTLQRLLDGVLGPDAAAPAAAPRVTAPVVRATGLGGRARDTHGRFERSA
jgi:hypothetical protein